MIFLFLPIVLIFSACTSTNFLLNKKQDSVILLIPENEYKISIETLLISSENKENCQKNSDVLGCKKCCQDRQDKCSAYAMKHDDLLKFLDSQNSIQLYFGRMDKKNINLIEMRSNPPEAEKVGLVRLLNTDSPCNRKWRNNCDSKCQK